MKPKKIPYYLLLLLLTIGASLIIGFLSFTGMFTLAPILGLAVGAFILSVAYEGEIYLQNIKGALNKLFKRDFLKNQLANDSLVKQFENNAIDTEAEDCPQFFKDYEAQLKLLHKFSHKRLDQKSQEAKRKIEKTLKDMEKWYTKQLFSDNSDSETSTGYETELGQWLRKSKRAEMRRLYQLYLNHQEEGELLIPDENSTASAWVTEYLSKQFEKETINTEAANCPQFFKDYRALLDELADLPSNDVDTLPEAQRQAQATLTDMQKQFASLMLSDEVELQNLTNYERELYTWMTATPHEEANSLYAKRNYTYKWVIAFSAVSGFFMSVGITYLLVEAFAILPVLATLSFTILPVIIVPMALISGVAYTFLIYNAVTDMIHNDTLRKWYYKIRNDLKQGVTPRSVFIAVSAVVLLALTIALTICTAGTWWTVAKNAQPLFSWMSKMPSFIMGVINPIILGLSQLIFNLQNTSESLEMIDGATRIEDNFFKKIGKGISEALYNIWDNENWLQMLNPFRIILKLTVTPLRLLFFFGHLISIGVTADRVPGMPEIASAILGIISEGFEDLHYFLGDLLHNDHHHHHSTKDLLKERFGEGHGHDHSADIPTRIIKFLATPIYAAAAGWDYVASRFVRVANPCGLIQIDAEAELSFAELSPYLEGKSAVVLQNDRLYYANHRTDKVKEIKQTEANRNHYETLAAKIAGGHRMATVEELELISSLTGRHGEGKSLSWEEAWDRSTGQPPKESVIIKSTAKKPSNAWQIEQSMQRIDRYLENHLNQASIYPERAAEKAEGLTNLRRDLQQMENPNETDIKARLVDEAKNPVYSRQRFFKTGNPTRTEDFLAELPERISAPAA